MSQQHDPAIAFQRIFATAHAGHARCLADEWLAQPCPGPNSLHAGRSIVWSRRNGPWRRVDLVFIGAAPGNAGGRGSGELGAHATRIPFGGDVAGANLDLLLASIGRTRNDVFIAAALNCLPVAGGGEPTAAELRAPVGAYASSLHLLRDTLIAAGPALVVCLGNVAVRAVAAAVSAPAAGRMPSLRRLGDAGLQRGQVAPLDRVALPDRAFSESFRARTGSAEPDLLWLLHPSAQNMSPYASAGTRFHTRMVETRDALRRAVRDRLDLRAPADAPDPLPDHGVYSLPEWRERVGPHHARLIALWRERGL